MRIGSVHSALVVTILLSCVAVAQNRPALETRELSVALTPSVECDAIYIGPAIGSPYLASNWEPHLPRAGHVACIPADSEESGAEAVARLFGQVHDLPFEVRVIVGRASPAEAMGFPSFRNPPPPTAIGACCLRSMCAIMDYFECRDQGGYFNEGIVACLPTTCGTGVCCRASPECTDDDGLGGQMDQGLCDLFGGEYVGGADCDETDPCQRFRIPEGFEIVEATPGLEMNAQRFPSINNCGQIAFQLDEETENTQNIILEIYVYENGLVSRITENDTPDVLPDINDDGIIVWVRNATAFGGGEILLLRDGERTTLSEGTSPTINNLGHVAWEVVYGGCAFKSDIFFYEGNTTTRIFENGLSNQVPEINKNDQITWTTYTFPCGPGPWTSQIMLYDAGDSVALPSTVDTPQVSAIDNIPRVAWDASPIGLELWETGITTLLIGGNIAEPALNDRGDVAYLLSLPSVRWQVRLFRDGAHFNINSDLELQTRSNVSVDMNDLGEIIWKWKTGFGTPNGIRYMRRIRDGDVDFDGDVDIDDFIPMPFCFTGSIPTDGLCECRFFDIDHDRDIDDDDYALFMRVYTGPLDDCDANGTLDLDELLHGSASDCNLNGVPDRCDMTLDPSLDLDGDGVIDACCVQAAPLEPVSAIVTSRYLSFEMPEPDPPPLKRQGTVIGVPQAVRVTFVDLPAPFDVFNGRSMWVGPPREVSELGGRDDDTAPTFMGATLQCEPYYTHWQTLGTVHVSHANIVPDGVYDVQAIRQGCGFSSATADARYSRPATDWKVGPTNDDAGANAEDSLPATDWKVGPTNDDPRANARAFGVVDVNFSPPLRVVTGNWSDAVGRFLNGQWTPPDGRVDVTADVVAVIDKFANRPGSPSKVRVDFEPATPDRKINVTDLTVALDAFRGESFPFTPSAPPCP